MFKQAYVDLNPLSREQLKEFSLKIGEIAHTHIITIKNESYARIPCSLTFKEVLDIMWNEKRVKNKFPHIKLQFRNIAYLEVGGVDYWELGGCSFEQEKDVFFSLQINPESLEFKNLLNEYNLKLPD